MLIETDRVYIDRLAERHARALSRYFVRNQQHLEPWEPLRPDGYHSEESWKLRARAYREEHRSGSSLRLLAFEHQTDDLVGICEFTNITRGPFQACHLGYSIDARHEGKGLMSEILDSSLSYVFRQLGLHRVMANYVPENERSARVLERLGFEKEGYAKSYLQIAGRWRDHVLTAKINPRHESR